VAGEVQRSIPIWSHAIAFTARYDAVNVRLLNEFLKEHCKVE
jgi:hypothetical protein